MGFLLVGEGETSADRFFGWIDNGGIEAMRVRGGAGFGGAEWDHLQYGGNEGPSPVPSASIWGLLLLTSLLGVVGLRRVKRR